MMYMPRQGRGQVGDTVQTRYKAALHWLEEIGPGSSFTRASFTERGCCESTYELAATLWQ